MTIEVVFFDVGGPIYSDRPYYLALLAAIREAAPAVEPAAFWAAFNEARADQRGPFTRRLILAFCPQERLDEVRDRAHALWAYPPETLLPDARPALEALRGRYRLGILANQERWIRETLARDGLDGFFEVWAVSAEVGADKPDPRIFEHALAAAGVPAERCAMVGDRLDNDVAAARAHGMYAVWLLRGEAPDAPTPAQLGQADATIRSLAELPAALEGLARG